MKSAFLMLLLAVGVVGGVAYLMLENASRSAESVFASARERMGRNPPDNDGAMRELGLALRMAEDAGEGELVAQILFERARLLLRRGTYPDAVSDLEQLLAEHDAQDIPALMTLAAVHLAAGDLDTAIAAADNVLALEPTNSGALSIRARAYWEHGERILANLDREMELLLPDQDAYEARRLIRRITAMYPEQPRRPALVHRLRQLFPGQLENTEELIENQVRLAGERFVLARQNYAQSFERSINVRAATDYLDLLTRADHLSGVVAVGLAFEDNPQATQAGASLALLAVALQGMQRPAIAARVIGRTNSPGRPIPPAFRVPWCEMLYAAEEWELLKTVARMTRSMNLPGSAGTRARNNGAYYEGLALYHLGEYEAAIEGLSRFTRAVKPREPLAAALGLSQRIKALCARELGRDAEEQNYLQLAVGSEPDADGEAWLRLATLQQQAGEQSRAVAHSLTMAMRLLPERDAEILPTWVQVGDAALLESGDDLVLLRQNLRSQNQWYRPGETVTGYEVLQLARAHREHGEDQGAILCCTTLLERYPDFLPAIELLADINLQGRKVDRAAELLLRRAELIGSSDPSAILDLRQLPEGTLSNAQIRRLMVADPRRTGLVVLARGLFERGRAEQALAALEKAGLAEVGSPGQLLAAQIYASLEDWPRVGAVLESIGPTDGLFLQATRLRVEAALASRGELDVATLVTEVLACEALDPDEVFPIAAALLQRGNQVPALVLLRHLETLNTDQRGEVLLRLAIATLLTEEPGEANRLFDRAAAFRHDGAPEIGRMLQAAVEKNWPALPSRVRELRRTGYQGDVHEAVAMAAMEGNLNEARVLADTAQELAPHDPALFLARAAIAQLEDRIPAFLDEVPFEYRARTLRFLRGRPESPRDPREALAHLFALRHSEWSLWSLVEMRDVDVETGGGLWPDVLAALAYRRLGDLDAARRALVNLVRSSPSSPGAWRLLEDIELERLGDANHPELLKLRALRRTALDLVPEVELAEARYAAGLAHWVLGQLPAGLLELRAALELDPDFLPARIAAARLLEELGELDRAVAHFGRYFAAADPEDSRPAIHDFLTLLERSTAAGTTSRSVFEAEIEALATRFPNDPFTLIALARREITEAPRPSIGVARALQLLEDFRQRTGGAAIENLAPGATRVWLDFLLDHETELAEEFVRGELDLLPDFLDLWTMLGEVFAAQHELAAAADQYREVHEICPDARTALLLADLLAEFGTEHEEVTGLLRDVALLAGLDLQDARLQMIRARSMVNAQQWNESQGIAIYQRLWSQRGAGDPVLPAGELEGAYGLALLHRGRAQDRERAREMLLTARQRSTDVVEREVLLSLANLTHQMRRQPPGANARPGGGAGGQAEGAAAQAPAGAAPAGDGTQPPQDGAQPP